MNKIIKHSLIDAGGTALYIIILASFIFYGIDNKLERTPSVLIPILMLMLLVFSVAVTGTLIFGKPLLWYLEGKKKEAILLLTYTLVFFLIIILLILFLLKISFY